jgi:putative CocE/NonD family hydrolase
MSAGTHRPRTPGELFGAVVNRSWHLPPRLNGVSVDRDLRVPMRDGTVLLADHYGPVPARERPTVLMRTPYGRGWQFAMMARPFAERGYHVLLQSSRGTFGSGGTFMPGVFEASDGQDTVAWLRTQAWFNGKLALVGASYLAFSAWALATEPPPELTAIAVHISPHDLAAAGFRDGGAFELFNLLSWSELMSRQEQVSAVRGMWRLYRTERRLATALGQVPLTATASVLGPGAPWYAEWLEHPDPADRYWDGYRAGHALNRVTVPTLLVSGFHDFFVEQTVLQYRALRDRQVPVGLTIGPWNHLSIDMGLVTRETLDWLDAFADGNEASDGHPGSRAQPVRVWTSGRDHWNELPDWPPAEASSTAWYLQPGGGLTAATPRSAAIASTFRYDPADPTPSVGGRIMSMTSAGSRDNTGLERRRDVLTFTTPPLDDELEVAGTPSVRLHLSSDNGYCDVFVRLCDVDDRGISRNLTDQIVRLTPDRLPPGTITEVSLRLTDVSHVFLAGHRIRLQVSGGAHPRFGRNLGTAGHPATSSALVPATVHVVHTASHQSSLSLPVVPGPEPAAAPADDAVAAAGSPAD